MQELCSFYATIGHQWPANEKLWKPLLKKYIFQENIFLFATKVHLNEFYSLISYELRIIVGNFAKKWMRSFYSDSKFDEESLLVKLCSGYFFPGKIHS